MIKRSNEEELNNVVKSGSFRTFYSYSDIEDRVDLSQIEDTGVCFLDKNKKVLSIYKCDNVHESESTMKKVIAVWDLGEEEITKVEKIKYIIKGVLDICFKKKISTAVLASLFTFMIAMGFKERYYIIVVMYLWGLAKITNASEAFNFIKKTSEEFKLREEALVEGGYVDFVNGEISEDVEDIKLYLTLKKNRLE